MEITQQVSALEGEVNLLKGEIKSILKELRTALLNRDNPFAPEGAPPTFRAVGRSGAAEDTSGEDAERPPPAPATPDPTPEPNVGEAPARPEPTPLHSAAEAPAVGPPAAALEASSEPRWSLLTIASLAVWVEDSVATLGPRRFQLTLELACLAGVVSDDTREVLAKLHDLAPASEEVDDRPLHINECLVVVRQLEAILHGEKVTKLPRRRRARRTRVR